MRPRAIAATRLYRAASRTGKGRALSQHGFFRQRHRFLFFVQEARRIVSGAAASFRAISAARLNVSQRSHLRPIDVVVYDGPQRRPHLGAGFALRCPQRLSVPDAATRLRGWRHDRHTVGPSDPVLSY